MFLKSLITGNFSRTPIKSSKCAMTTAGSDLDSPVFINDNTKYNNLRNIRAMRPVSSKK